MQVLVRTDNHVRGSQELMDKVELLVKDSLERFSNQLTRVEVHLTDEASSSKSRDNDKRCVMEARLAGMQPISVTHHGATIDQVLDGAVDKLKHLLDRTLGRLEDNKGRPSYSGE